MSAKKHRSAHVPIDVQILCSTNGHRWKRTGYDNKDMHFQCSRCMERYVRQITKAEKPLFNILADITGPMPLHNVWHDFCRKFMCDSRWRWTSNALTGRIDRWALKYPQDVRTVRVDDSYHAGSNLYLIEHKEKDRYMGTTVVFVPQCSGETPITFFLYPSHRAGLLRALQGIAKVAKVVQRREVKSVRAQCAIERATVKLPSKWEGTKKQRSAQVTTINQRSAVRHLQRVIP